MLTREDQIDVICDSFEEQLACGERPLILEFVEMAPLDLASDVFSELLGVEIEYRSKRGEAVTKAEYLERYPSFSEAIETVGYDLAGTATPTPSSSARLERSKTFGHRFILDERVGSGAAGEVWRALDLTLSRTVAIKIPRATYGSSEERERFRREGMTAAQLRHPNIVAVHEAVQEAEVDYIVSDFIQGTHLRQRLAEKPFAIDDAARICIQVADALHYAHEQGVVHRDLKPANIILDQGDQVHITDFGLAKWSGHVEEVTLSGDLLGTPAYMSPEQARGESSKVDRRADVYSTGVILYEMMTGRCPFTGGHAAVLDGIINLPPRRPRLVNPPVPRDPETVCLKALEKGPHARYPSAGELAEDLRRYLTSQPIRARQTGALRRAWLWGRRRPAWVCLGLIGPLALLGVLASSQRLPELDYRLAGLQSVSLTTSPSGARLKFIPLNETSGRPEPESEAVISAKSPFAGGMKPGDYLVVAVLADGRFHEVIRHVPQRADAIPSGDNHSYWKVQSDGSVELPAVEIPGRDVLEGMVRISEGTNEDRGDRESTLRIAPFFLDPREFTWGEYQIHVNHGRWPDRARKLKHSPSDWMPANYNQAPEYAEAVGKRIMTREEYAQASAVLIEANRKAGRTERTPHQLTPEIPEWTQSRPVNGATILRSDLSQLPFIADWYREVVGVPPPQALIFRSRTGGKTTEITAARRSQMSGIGFRCVRSERPRFMDSASPRLHD